MKIELSLYGWRAWTISQSRRKPLENSLLFEKRRAVTLGGIIGERFYCSQCHWTPLIIILLYTSRWPAAIIPVWPALAINWVHIVALWSRFFFNRNSLAASITTVPIFTTSSGAQFLRDVANCSLFIQLLRWGGSRLARQMASAGASERSPAGPQRMQPARLSGSAECISSKWKMVCSVSSQLIIITQKYWWYRLQEISAFDEKIIQTWSSFTAAHLLRCSIVQRRRRTEKWSFLAVPWEGVVRNGMAVACYRIAKFTQSWDQTSIPLLSRQ